MLLRRIFALGSVFALSACVAPADPENGDDGPLGEATAAITVAAAASQSCSTLIVKGLAVQITTVANCISPGAFVEVPPQPNVAFGATVFPYLEQPARDAFVKTLNDNPGMTMGVNSMLRTVAQQYLLYHWYQNNQCGIGLAATPGGSNHETGLAFDTSDQVAWQGALSNHGFKWFGNADPVHFDYVGAGAVSYKGTDVLAFQKLWNANNPGDQIGEDGQYGPNTEARLQASPADGFPIVPACGPVTPAYGAKWIAQTYPMTMNAGDTATVELTYENVGAKAWDGSTHLGTTAPRDRASVFAGPEWIGPNRPAGVSGTVAPGAQYSFSWTLHAPMKPGVYTEHWGLVEEQVAWFGDPGQGGPADDAVWFKITVDAPVASGSGGGGTGGSGGGEQTSAGGAGGSSGGAGGGIGEDASGDTAARTGCACELGPRSDEGPISVVALAFGALLIRLRRRR